VPRDATPDLQVVDRPHVPGGGDLERRAPDVEDRHPVVLAVRVGNLLGEAQDVAVEREGGVVVLRLDDEPELADGRRCGVRIGHAATLRSSRNK